MQSKIKKIHTATLIAFLAISFSIVSANPQPTSAQSVNELNTEISDKKNKIDKLEESQEKLEKEIQQKQNEKRSLENQIAIVDAEIETTKSEIRKTQLEIDKIKLEIEKTRLKIEEKEEDIQNQKSLLGEYLRVMQQYDDKSPLELLLGQNSFSEFLDQVEYVETLENKGQETLDDIQKLKNDLEWQKQVLEAKDEKLGTLKSDLEDEEDQLNTEKKGKNILLEETELQEEKYQELLEQSKREHEQAERDIANLESQVQRKLEEQKQANLVPDDWQEYSGGATLAWPIIAKRGISAGFQDASYKNYFGVPHYAIDIPAPQNTIIHAPADGYVSKYRNAGYGYSYLVLHHGGDLSTVYGHIPAALVSEGTYVKKGDPIAKVGGTPGTLGAGWMTTGAHLHFETRINGKPVNPMQFLPPL